MELWTFLYLVIGGFILGSFYNVVGLRVPLKESLVTPRSSCPNCKKVLSSIELIPIISFVIQVGKCRHCKVSISPIYPCMEIITGFLFVVAPLIVGWEIELLYSYALVSLLVIVTVSDLAYMIIPDKILLFFLPLFIALQMIIPNTYWVDSLLGGLIGFGLLFIISLLTGGGMGGGDIKLFALLGFILGVKYVVLAFFFSVIIGAVFGMIVLLIGVLKKRQPMPFGPFIAVGALLSYFYGEQIVNWYFGVIV